MKYSIIIPVYNAEKYIEECILSVLNQKASTEIILVDDGSKDSSGKICDRYISENVHVYHIENSGPGSARNFGAEKANGEFLMFMDADDYLSTDFFEKLECSDTDFGAELIFFETIKFFGNGKEEFMAQGLKKSGFYKKSKEEVYTHISKCNKFPASTCGKIINLKFYNESKIKMPCNILGEDIDWTLELIMKASSFDFFEEGFYYYRQGEETRSTFGRRKSVEDSLFIIEKWVDLINNSEYKNSFSSFLAYQYAMIFPFVGALEKTERKIFSKKMKKYKYLLKFGKTKKLNLIKYAVNIFGVNMASVILYKYVSERDSVK